MKGLTLKISDMDGLSLNRLIGYRGNKQNQFKFEKKLRNKVLCARESSSPIEDFLGEGEESVGVLFTTTKSRFNIGVLTSVVKKPMLT